MVNCTSKCDKFSPHLKDVHNSLILKKSLCSQQISVLKLGALVIVSQYEEMVRTSNHPVLFAFKVHVFFFRFFVLSNFIEFL